MTDILFNTDPPLLAPQIDGWSFNQGTEENFSNYLSIFRENIDDTCGTLPLSFNEWISKKCNLVYYTSQEKSIGLALIDRRTLYMPCVRIFSFSSTLPSEEIVDFLEIFANTLNESIAFSATKETGKYAVLNALAERLNLKPISCYNGQFDYWRKK